MATKPKSKNMAECKDCNKSFKVRFRAYNAVVKPTKLLYKDSQTYLDRKKQIANEIIH